MKTFFKMLENVFAAVAFAESGEWETARMIANGSPRAGRIYPTPPKPSARPRVRA